MRRTHGHWHEEQSGMRTVCTLGIYKWVNDDKSRTEAAKVYEKHFNLISELIKIPGINKQNGELRTVARINCVKGVRASFECVRTPNTLSNRRCLLGWYHTIYLYKSLYWHIMQEHDVRFNTLEWFDSVQKMSTIMATMTVAFVATVKIRRYSFA